MAEEKKKTRRPTAAKRQIQNEKKRLQNKSFKSNARTTMRHFEEALKSRNNEDIQEKLERVYSVMDKGAKRGLYKINKASRLKARAAEKARAAI